MERQFRVRAGKEMLLVAPFLLLLVISPFTGLFQRYPPTAVVGPAGQGPSADHWFGTDSSGLDVWARVWAAMPTDLYFAAGVTFAAVIIAILFGFSAAVLQERNQLSRGVSSVILRAFDLIDSVPAVVLGLVIVGLFGSALLALGIAVTIVVAPQLVRLMYSEVVRVLQSDFAMSFELGGIPLWRRFWTHVLPNAIGPVIISASWVFALSMLVLGALGYLGVGIQPPTPEWGNMIAGGLTDLQRGRWWSAMFPALFISITVAAASAFSIGLKKLWRAE